MSKDDDILYNKFKVERTDGHTLIGAKYFVLDYGTDPDARFALKMYALAIQDEQPGLAANIHEALREF